MTTVWDSARFGDWAEYIDNHADSTIYHHPDWLQVMASSFPFRLHLLVALRNGRLVGGVPLMEVRSPWSRRLVAVPYRDRGGLLWSEPAAFIALTQAIQRLSEERRCPGVILKSLQPYPEDLRTATALQEQFHWVNSSIDLTSLSPESLPRRLGAKTRNMLRQADKAGLVWEDASDQPGAVAEFYGLHLLSQRHLGVPAFPRGFFVEQRQRLGSAWRLFMVRREGRPVAGSIVFLWRQQAIYAYSCSDPTTLEMRPNDLLLFGILGWLLNRNYRVFDLGSDSPIQKGLLFFKRKWLATQRVCPVYYLGRLQVQDSSSPTFRIARSILSRMPLWLLQLTSRWIHWFG